MKKDIEHRVKINGQIYMTKIRLLMNLDKIH